LTHKYQKSCRKKTTPPSDKRPARRILHTEEEKGSPVLHRNSLLMKQRPPPRHRMATPANTGPDSYMVLVKISCIPVAAITWLLLTDFKLPLESSWKLRHCYYK